MSNPKSTPKKKSKAEQSFSYITDILSGDDGGVPFVYTLAFVREMQGRVDKGDADAAKVLEVVYAFERLIRLAQPK